jgi:glycosyltransferase involved in cell wall biosynthesis
MIEMMTTTRKAPTISVVIPCYNGGKFLDLPLDSLARQTFRDFEVVIINDGSTDQATKDKLTTLDPSIRIVHQVNKGLSAARNTGFREATADLVLALDSDDQLEPTYLEETLHALQAAPEAGFVVTHIRQVGAAQAIEKRYVNAFDVLFKNVTGYSMLMRKAAWQTAGGYDETMRDGYEDWEFNLRLINSGYRGVAIDKPLFIYTVSAQGMLMSHSSQRHAGLWRRIRVKHREMYRPMNLLRLYWQNRRAHSEISAATTMAALMLTSILPDKWYSAIVSSMRYHRFTRSKRAATTVVRPSPLRGS